MQPTSIIITGLDNMKTRKDVYEVWRKEVYKLPENYEEGDAFQGTEDYLLIDGRLILESMEVLCLQGNLPEQVEGYKEYLFNDNEVEEVDCTMKQSTFAAMTIAGIITSTLCNWATNKKAGYEEREVPFYQRLHLPSFTLKNITYASKEIPQI